MSADPESDNFTIEPEQVRAARALLGWSQDDLASRAGINRRTLIRYETCAATLKPETKFQIYSILRAAGIEFSAETDERLGVSISYQARMDARLIMKNAPVSTKLL